MPAIYRLQLSLALAIASSTLFSCHSGSGSTGASDTLTTPDGFVYRDLNKNGKLDVYEDRRQPVSALAK